MIITVKVFHTLIDLTADTHPVDRLSKGHDSSRHLQGAPRGHPKTQVEHSAAKGIQRQEGLRPPHPRETSSANTTDLKLTTNETFLTCLDKCKYFC